MLAERRSCKAEVVGSSPATGVEYTAGMPHQGHLVGPQLQPVQVAAVLYMAGFRGAEDLVMATAIAHAECAGQVGSYCDDTDDKGHLLQRDCGLMQIGVEAKDVGTAKEKALYDPAENARQAYLLWARRKWQPWSSYNTGIVFDDKYMALGLLGSMNYLAWRMGREQLLQKDPARAAHHIIAASTSPPGANGRASALITIPQFRTMYPGIPV